MQKNPKQKILQQQNLLCFTNICHPDPILGILNPFAKTSTHIQEVTEG